MDKKYIFIIVLLAVILVVSILYYLSQGLRKTYVSEVWKGLDRTEKLENSILTEAETKHLPEPVQKYLAYVGAIGKDKVKSVRIAFDGELRSAADKEFFKIQSEQYNFFDHPTRLFFIDAKMNGLPVVGLHAYTDEEAYMLIKVAGLITVQEFRGQEIRISDTSTLFNDMCLFAPSTLIDKRIQWEELNELEVKATFNTGCCKVSAELHFNEKGELINFITDDRYMAMPDGSAKKARWSTPARDYKTVNGIKVPTYAEAIWNLPEGDFCYGKFIAVKSVEYNCKNFK